MIRLVARGNRNGCFQKWLSASLKCGKPLLMTDLQSRLSVSDVCVCVLTRDDKKKLFDLHLHFKMMRTCNHADKPHQLFLVENHHER